jgi:hypothetical protein
MSENAAGRNGAKDRKGKQGCYSPTAILLARVPACENRTDGEFMNWLSEVAADSSYKFV